MDAIGQAQTVFRAEETHGRALRKSNEVIAESQQCSTTTIAPVFASSASVELW
jgi:hypothetical protein